MWMAVGPQFFLQGLPHFRANQSCAPEVTFKPGQILTTRGARAVVTEQACAERHRAAAIGMLAILSPTSTRHKHRVAEEEFLVQHHVVVLIAEGILKSAHGLDRVTTQEHAARAWQEGF